MITHNKHLHVKLIKNAIIFPATGENISTKNSIQGVQSRHPEKDPEDFGLTYFGKNLTDYKKRSEFLKKNKLKKLSGKYLYLGAMFTDHFGHFLAESIHRFWACKYFEDEVSGFIILSPHRKFTPTEVFHASCHLLEVDIKKIILVNELSEIELLIIPDLGSSIGTTPKKWYLREISKKIFLGKLKNPSLPKKLFIRRGHQYLSRTIGLSYFLDLIRQNGFIEFFPENLPFLDQVKYIISADYVLWEEGSACHIFEILPTIHYKQSILIKRKEKETAIDLTLNSRIKNQERYKNIKKVFSGTGISCDVSRMKDPGEFYDYLKIKKIIKGDDRFNILYFWVYECYDFLSFYTKYLEIKTIYFLLEKVKPNVNLRLWNIFKNLAYKTQRIGKSPTS